MNTIYTSEIAKAIGAKCNINEKVNAISTDSRAIEKGSAFVAIEGENFDGHNFIKSVLDNGAVCVISHKKQDFDDERILYVENTSKALLDIAKMYRNKFDVKVIGVTGSVGKTTSKDFISCVVSSKYKTLKSEGNENNEIGLPKTVFKLNESYEACVLEMGMSNFGEIEELTMVAQPNIAVITNIGVCHLEYLKTRENILKAKLEICDGMKENSPLILCADNDLLKEVNLPKFKMITYGIENSQSDILASDIVEENEQTQFKIHINENTFSAVIPTIGKHNVLNALAAIAVGREMNISIEDCISALKNYEPSGMRQNIVNINGIIIVEDCYNASPDSMKAAMKTLGEYSNDGRKIAVLADMLELGTISESEHSKIGDVLCENKIDEAFTFGEKMKFCTKRAYELGIQAMNYDTKEELTRELLDLIKVGDMVWVKGSRGMKLEEVIKDIYAKLGK
ncbi:MAG: UDP-N-acetylmuramoyl-tripeptide--D-alanyl-D-alanine ligase [Oscillospiraceae bacterium]